MLTLFWLIATMSGAKSMSDMLLSMPDSLVPYLNTDIRLALLRQHNDGGAAIQSLLHEDVAIDSLTEDYLKLSLSKSSALEAMRLESADGYLVCVVRTYFGPAAESTVELYDSLWHRMPSQQLPQVAAADLVAKPDTMDNAQFEQALSDVDPLLVSIHAEPSSHSLVYSPTLPLASKEGEEKLKAIMKPQKLTWNGSKFRQTAAIDG